MLRTLYATKLGMTQAWSKTGKRLVVTRLTVEDNAVISKRKTVALNKNTHNQDSQDCFMLEIGYGKKKLKNCTKPLQEKIKKSGFSNGFTQIKGLKLFFTPKDQTEVDALLKPGDLIGLAQVLEVGDIVKVQGQSKGKGFAGVMKRHGFHGGPRTHGQSDRERAPGAIGCRTDPGRVWKGKKMPGHMGDEMVTVSNLVVLHIDQNKKEIWLSGPVPGFNSRVVRITKTDKKKTLELDFAASGIKLPVQQEVQTVEQQAQPVEKITEEKKVAPPSKKSEGNKESKK